MLWSVERERFRNLHWRQYIVFVKYSKHCCRCYQKLQENDDYIRYILKIQDILPMYFEILERLSSISNSFKHSFNTFISFPYVVGSCARGVYWGKSPSRLYYYSYIQYNTIKSSSKTKSFWKCLHNLLYNLVCTKS